MTIRDERRDSMKAVGVVVEYNPFHNGHYYHIQQAKVKSKADIVIAVMSGQFLQRGEPALVDKWCRTKMALANGVDIVMELPYVYSTAQATDFAKGAITLLNAIGCESFVFGSEDGELTPFLNTWELIENNRTTYNELIRTYIKQGNSYPKALFLAYKYLQQQHPNHYIDLSQPNNILGFHYIEAAAALNHSITPLTIPRVGAGYHETIKQEQPIASATGIRKVIFEKQNLTDIHSYVPPATYSLLQQWHDKYKQFGGWEAFWPLLQFTIIRQTPEQLTQFAEVTEGIEYALIKAAKSARNFNEFMLKIKSKRYTWTRIQRMLTHIFTGFTKEQLYSFHSPSYIRLLGMTSEGQKFLSTHKKNLSLPLISRVGATTDTMLQIDIHATDLYALGIEMHSHTSILNRDYQTPPIRVK